LVRDFFRGEKAVTKAYPDPSEARDLKYEDVIAKGPIMFEEALNERVKGIKPLRLIEKEVTPQKKRRKGKIS
jgi:hypothetical protein